MSNRIVKLPSVESFGRLTPDKWHESYQAALMEMIETFEKGETV